MQLRNPNDQIAWGPLFMTLIHEYLHYKSSTRVVGNKPLFMTLIHEYTVVLHNTANRCGEREHHETEKVIFQ